MNNLDSIKSLPYWEGVTENALSKLCSTAETVHIEEGSVITQQFQSASDFYLLQTGSVDHYLTLLNETQVPLPVGRLDTPWSAVGWSGLVEPHRYTTQIICSTPSTLLHWDYKTLKSFASLYPEVSLGLLRLVAESGKALLEQSRRFIQKNPNFIIDEEEAIQSRPPRLRLKLNPDKAINYLSYSSLFQDLMLYELKQLAEHCWLERYRKGISIFSENDPAHDVLILVKGTITLCYTAGHSSNELATPSSRIFVRSLSQPGQIISWAALTQSQRQDITAIASDDATLCSIPASIINQYCTTKTRFAIKLQKKLINIVGSRLRSTRALLINQQTGNEQSTVSSLLHNIGPQLSVHSSLHKLPHLLKNRMTQEDAFSHLKSAQRNGSHFEKNVAGLCDDILRETRGEFEFYKGLQSIYQMIVTDNNTSDPQTLRNKSAIEFIKLFSNTRYLIQGEHFLPETGGHIFIMNHLVSHPYHKLANGFEFSLDTHFLSSMILYRKYGDSGTRIVRKNRHEEYGHENYYKKLGHIYAYTSESQPAEDGVNSIWRNRLYTEATRHIQQGNNIIMCPEGTSYWSHESPGPFKSGAFRLAAIQNPETFIVPVVVAGFDKLLSDTVFTAIIKPPFKINEVIDPNNPDPMKALTSQMHAAFKTYVQQAQKISPFRDN